MPQRLNLHGNQPAPVLLPRALARALAEREGAQAHRKADKLGPPPCAPAGTCTASAPRPSPRAPIVARALVLTTRGTSYSLNHVQACSSLPPHYFCLCAASKFLVSGHDLNGNYVQFGIKRPKLILPISESVVD